MVSLPQHPITQSAVGSVPPLDAAGTVKRGGLLAATGQGCKLVLQLGSTAVLARLLSPADFGLLSLVTPLVAFFYVFRDIGLTSATIYVEDITDAEVTSLFWINVGAGVLLAILLVAMAPLAAIFYSDWRLTGVLSAMALTFVFNGVAAQYYALFQRRFRFKAMTVIGVGSTAAGTLAGIAAAILGYGYWSLVVMPITTQAISLLAALLISSWQPGAPRWESRTAMMTRFGSAIAGFNFLNYFARNVDNLLIGKFWGLESLGFYGRAYGLMMAPLSQIIYPLNQVIVPVLTRINGDRNAYVKTYIKIMRVIMLLCVPLVTWLLVARDWVVALLLGAQWHQTAPIFLALGFSALVQPMNNSAGWLILSQGRSRDVFLSGLLGCCVAVASILAGLPWGALQVAISYSIGQIFVMTPILWWFSCRNNFVRVSDLLAASLPFWAAAAVAGLSFEAFRFIFLDSSLSPFSGLILSFVWVIGIDVALLAIHPSGRDLLAKSAAALRGFIVPHQPS